MKKRPEIPFGILMEPEYDDTKLAVGVSETREASLAGSFFLAVGRADGTRHVARISSMDTLDNVDMGYALLFATSPELLKAASKVLRLAKRSDFSLEMEDALNELSAVCERARGEA